MNRTAVHHEDEDFGISLSKTTVRQETNVATTCQHACFVCERSQIQIPDSIPDILAEILVVLPRPLR